MVSRRKGKRGSISWPVLVFTFQRLDSSERVHTAQSSLPTMHCQQKLRERLYEKGSAQSPMAQDSA